MGQYTGEIAALGTAFCWALGSLIFSRARVPAAALNLFKNVVATVLLLLTLWIVAHNRGTPTFQAGASAWGWLTLSGIVGIVIGDTFYFRSLQILGARRALVLTTLCPPMAALFAWYQIAEKPQLWALIGMFVTLSGVLVVIRERGTSGEGAGHYPGSTTAGVVFGLLGAASQAVGASWAKAGMQEETGALEATFIRLLTAAVIGFLYCVARGYLREWARHLFAAGVPARLIPAATVGSYLGIWLSLVAFKETTIANATTLTSLMPVFIIPLVWIFLRQRVSPRAILGALIAVIGVFLLFVRSTPT